MQAGDRPWMPLILSSLNNTGWRTIRFEASSLRRFNSELARRRFPRCSFFLLARSFDSYMFYTFT